MVRRGRLPVADACRAARDAARGLAHAHAAGLVHRDVKPSNLIRTPDGVTKVLDFGLVIDDHQPDGLTHSNVIMGTPDYLAPEQARNAHAADARADIYSLGCTLYHLLAGRVPFPDEGLATKVLAHQVATPDPLTGVPPALAPVVAKMMARKPADRYQSADEVAAALEPFATGAPPELLPPAPRPPFPVVVAGVVGLVGLVALAVGVAVSEDLSGHGHKFVTAKTDDGFEVAMRQNGELIRVADTRTNQTWEVCPRTLWLTPDGPEVAIDLPGKERLAVRRAGGGVTVRREIRPPVAPAPDPAGPDTPVWSSTDHTGTIRAVAYSPDGTHALSGSADGTVRLVDAKTGAPVWVAPQGAAVHAVAFVSIDRVLVGGSGGMRRLLDAKTGAVVKDFPPDALGDIRSVSVTRDGLLAAAAGEGGFRVWELVGGRERAVVGRSSPSFVAVAYSPDGGHLAAGGADGAVRVFDTASGREMGCRPNDSSDVGHFLTWSPDGQGVVYTIAGDVRVWDWRKGPHVRSVGPPTAGRGPVAVSPDGTLLLTGHAHDPGVRLWDFETGQPRHTYPGLSDPIRAVAFSPDGGFVLAGGGGEPPTARPRADAPALRLWRLPSTLLIPPQQ